MLIALLGACALDAASRGVSADRITAWLFGTTPDSPVLVVQAKPDDATGAFCEEYHEALRRAVLIQASVLPETPAVAVVLGPGRGGHRVLSGAAWDGAYAAEMPYPPPNATLDAIVVRIAPRDSIARSALAVAREARRAALN